MLRAGFLACALAGSLAGGSGPARTESQDASAASGAKVHEPWADFPVMVWRQRYRGKPLPEDLVAPFGGCNVERDEAAEFALSAGLDFYVGHGPGRDVLHLDRHRDDWQRAWRPWSRDPSGPPVKRPDDPSDPRVRRELHGILGVSLAARGGQHGIGVSLGDEVSWTPWGDPVDLRLHPSAEERWNDLRRATFGEPTGTPWIPRTEEVRRAWLRGETGALGPWLLRRRFEQDLLVELLGELADGARTASPGVGVGLLGLSGRTAFGGASVDRCLPFLDFAEAYATGDARELLMSLRSPDQRTLSTVFLEADQAGRAAWQAWDHALRGGDGLVVWSDRLLENHGESARALARAVEDIRSLRRDCADWRPRPEGVAILHCEDSVALGFLRDALLDGPTWPHRFQGYQEEHGTRERDLRTWLRLAEDAGLQPGALPLTGPRAIDGTTVDRFPVLVANHLEVLDAHGSGRLREFLACGGHLIVHGRLGSFDAQGRTPETPHLETLAREFPGSVHTTPPHFDLYLGLRDAAEDRRVVEAQAFLRRVLRTAGHPDPIEPELRFAEGDPEPWFRASTWGRDRAEGILAYLPSPDRARRGKGTLSPRTVLVTPPEGWRLEVLHPRPKRSPEASAPPHPPGSSERDPTTRIALDAGEAFFLRLTRTR